MTQLPRALACICFSSYQAKLFHAAFTLAFFGFLRVGEIALSNCKSNSSTVLSISDISIQTSMLKVKIRFSKTVQFGKTTTLYIDSVPSSVFKSHSFRIGAASLASMKNMTPNVSQSWGRWKSDAYRGYILFQTFGMLAHPSFIGHRGEHSAVQSVATLVWRSMVYRLDGVGYEVELTTDTHPARFKKLSLPPVLEIQLSSNDLVSRASGVLRWEMKLDLLSLSKLPNTTVVWSCILPRLFWYGARSQVAIDNVRKRTNREISSYILKLGGTVITQSDLSDKETGCYRFDGIHLSDIGNDIYLNALQGALESFLIEDIRKF
ncbi:LOW QUALITY PROTEIN: hypothetical protein KUTeg_004292 [Tegillarca granosa]|uniref:Uncharacterized protein n=1 Tax=Tegillarca granosa TaxID=220873 RepID=A0ABQ9FR38_TEGGR|nr:LOW QUALITY PROTEIN: hypothetical protein KUTeg_004292 [Tegillarca granosa]